MVEVNMATINAAGADMLNRFNTTTALGKINTKINKITNNRCMDKRN